MRSIADSALNAKSTKSNTFLVEGPDATFQSRSLSGKKLQMRPGLILFLFVAMLCIISCKKENKATDCFPDASTVRVIDNKKAVVKLTATASEPVYLVEEGTVDTRLIPCNFPTEFYQHDLQVTISGEVKSTQQAASVPCCAQNFVISKISR